MFLWRPHLVAVLWLASGCSDEASSQSELCDIPVSLVDQHAWVAVAPEVDPFFPPADVDGSAWGRGRCSDSNLITEKFGEADSFKVDTRNCSWSTVEQPARKSVAAGELVSVRVYHFAQPDETEVAEARLIAAFGDTPFYQGVVPLPVAQGGLLEGRVVLTSQVQPGTPVRWHVRNHGANTWNLFELAVVRQQPCRK